jgi:hypothetical protein
MDAAASSISALPASGPVGGADEHDAAIAIRNRTANILDLLMSPPYLLEIRDYGRK